MDLDVVGTEVYAFGFTDPRAVFCSELPPVRSFSMLGQTLFPFDAECRGYCMSLFGALPIETWGIYG